MTDSIPDNAIVSHPSYRLSFWSSDLNLSKTLLAIIKIVAQRMGLRNMTTPISTEKISSHFGFKDFSWFKDKGKSINPIESN